MAIEPISSINSDSAQSPTTAPTTASIQKSHSSISGGTIGGIVAAVVAVVIMIGVLFCLRAKRKVPSKDITVAEPTADQPLGGQDDMGTELPKPEPKPPVEVLDTGLAEMGDRSFTGYYAPKGVHEMHDPTPVTQELPAQQSHLHEMFDDSVYREIHTEAMPK